MKAFATVLFVALFSVAGSNSVSRGQYPTLPFDYHLPGLDDNVRVRERNMTRPAREARVLTKGPLAPSAEDKASSASFLRRSDTGLIRLMPYSFKWSRFADRNQSVKIQGGGAYYSFAFISHEYGFGSDLHLSTTLRFYGQTEQPPLYELSVGFAGADYGLMTNLGDVLLETLKSNDPRVQPLASYKPPRSEPEARSECLRFRKGDLIDGRTYKSRLPIQGNTTYLLRSINYGRSDVLVAFRVVREDNDKSLIIAWQLLKKFAAPKLK